MTSADLAYPVTSADPPSPVWGPHLSRAVLRLGCSTALSSDHLCVLSVVPAAPAGWRPCPSDLPQLRPIQRPLLAAGES